MIQKAFLEQKFDRYVKMVRFSPRGGLVAVGDLNGRVHLWDIKQNKLIKEIRAKSGVSSLAFSPDGRRLAIGQARGVQLYNLETDQAGYTIGVSNRGGVAAFSPDGRYLLVGQARGEFQVWEVVGNNNGPHFAAKHARADQLGDTTHAAFLPDGRGAVTVHEDRAVRIWRLP